jgi:peptidyl-prolyl cis-trans isomerase D
MFEFIRSHQRLMQLALLLFIFPSFAFVGIQSYSHFGDSDDTVATVGKEVISKRELDSSQQEQTAQLKQRFGSQFDPKMLDTPQARQRILDNLIAQKALAAEVRRNKLAVSDQAVQDAILAIPRLTTSDGKFDVERYKDLLAAQGMTPAVFENRLRLDLGLQELNAAIQTTAFAPKAVISRLADLRDQEREIQELSFKNTDYSQKVDVSDANLKNYYNKNIALFGTPERVKIEYVVLSADKLGSQVTVSDADIKSFYDQNAKRFNTEEQRRASHILVAVNKDASPGEIAKAKAKAEKLLAQVHAAPSDFSKIAKENSDDAGSGERGGDLDFFSRGMMVKPFEDTAFALKKDQVSELVRSDFGFHIIKLTDVKPAAIKPLSEVHDEIAAEIKKQMSAKKYAESAELFTNTAYEQSDSLKPLSDKFKLKIETASGVQRQPANATDQSSPLGNAKFLSALFSNDALKNKRNTEVVEIAPTTLVAGRVIDYTPAGKLPFETVREQVKTSVMQIESANLARKAGEEMLAQLKKKDNSSAFSAPKIISRSKNNGLDTAAVATVMKANVITLPAVVGIALPDGYGIFKINKIIVPIAEDVARRQAEQQQTANAMAEQEMLAYIDALKKRLKVEVKAAALATAANDKAPIN